MKILVLGSAAGGGYPQWNCNCHNCSGIRQGTVRARRRTQSSIAITTDSLNWVLINASPDILTQLAANPALQPARAARDTGITAVILVDSQIDHTVGLFMLREGRPLEVYCTAGVHEDLSTGNPIFSVLGSYCSVNWHRIPIEGNGRFVITGIDGIRFEAVPVASKAPPFSPHRERHDPGDNIGLMIEDSDGRSIFYSPGLAAIDEPIASRMDRADCMLIDGTFWTDGEMIQQGVGQKLGRAMGHLAQSGPGGMIEMLQRWPRARRILIHINNTNPILDENSPERRALDRAGIEVAYDGMEIELMGHSRSG